MTRLPLYLLTQRRAVDLCRVRSSLCPSASSIGSLRSAYRR
ncbi:putative leader peptide [Saccharomonospora xinjiangensis]|nr:putative leader peptide [Saccharomonospora xinjiangensis]